MIDTEPNVLDFVPPAPLDLTPLQEALDTYAPEAAVPGFVLDSEEKAIWAARKLRQYSVEINKRRALAQQEIDRINAYLDGANKPLVASYEHFVALLTFYHQTVREQNPRLKTVKLPDATLKSRESTTWEINDEVFVTWADEYLPELVRVKREPNKADAKKLLTISESGEVISPEGEVVPGVTVTVGAVTYSVSVESKVLMAGVEDPQF